ncbi:MAG: hypothetical protein JJV95_01950 [Sulfurospirillum sp.]|nr:hypothetical protein [Sulfurospirillum sp.]MBL0702734.1 hypothetical protein [Sulfurospirillum sp.]
MINYQENLKNRKKELQECQKDKKIDSCMKCEKLFKCEIRKNYVKSVYESMSHGKTGGFEF